MGCECILSNFVCKFYLLLFCPLLKNILEVRTKRRRYESQCIHSVRTLQIHSLESLVISFHLFSLLRRLTILSDNNHVPTENGVSTVFTPLKACSLCIIFSMGALAHLLFFCQRLGVLTIVMKTKTSTV